MPSSTAHSKEAQSPPNSSLGTPQIKHIIIAGAGISGLSFPLALHTLWPKSSTRPIPKITIFERDTKADRLGPRQGYSLSIRVDGPRGGGVQVLDDLGLYEEVAGRAVVLSEPGKSGAGGDDRGGAMCLWEPKGVNGRQGWKEVLRIDGNGMGNHSRRGLGGMRVRRNVLQEVLKEAVERLDGVGVVWDRGVVGARRKDGGAEGMIVTTADGKEHECDLLLACDGSGSKIRGLLRPDKGLDYAGVVAVTGTAKFDKMSDVPEVCRRDWGLCLAFDGIGCFVSPVDVDPPSVVWSLSYKSEEIEPLKHPITDNQAKSLLEFAKALAKRLGPDMGRLIDATDVTTLGHFNAKDRPPFKHNLKAHGSVVWLGDGIHAVTPFAGNGANMALIDSWELAKSLIKHNSLDRAVAEYETEMIPRCQGVLNDSHRNISVTHASGLKGLLFWGIAKLLSWVFWAKSLRFR